MSTFQQLWFFLWRMMLLGLALGAALLGLYGAVLGAWAGGGLGLVVGFSLGSFYGFVPGLALGVVDGLLLGILAQRFNRYRHPEGRPYYEVAGWACATAGLLVLTAFTVPLYDPSAGLGVIELVRLWAVPVVAGVGASWWAGRKTVEWYAQEVLEARTARPSVN